MLSLGKIVDGPRKKTCSELSRIPMSVEGSHPQLRHPSATQKRTI